MKPLKKFMSGELNRVKKIVKSSLKPNGTIVNDMSFQLYNSGGKKLRPMFTILAGKLGDTAHYEDVLKTSASLELLHMATLVHDDIIDDSALRRGKPTVFYEHGYFQAINTGNYLLSSALQIVSKINNPKFHETYSSGIREIVQGELIQFDTQFDARQSLDEYYRKIYRKTALLIVLSIELGGYAAELNDKLMQHLSTYGYHIGMSFQIIDDCLDFTGSTSTLGKPNYSDIKNGHYTLPVLLLRDSDAEFKKMLEEFSETKENPEQLIQYILNTDALDRALEVSTEHLNAALAETEHIDAPIKQYFIEIADMLKNRRN